MSFNLHKKKPNTSDIHTSQKVLQYCWVSWVSNRTYPCHTQALPYVALLIAMLFFIYAVIGMQVSFFTEKSVSGVIHLTFVC